MSEAPVASGVELSCPKSGCCVVSAVVTKSSTANIFVSESLESHVKPATAFNLCFLSKIHFRFDPFCHRFGAIDLH